MMNELQKEMTLIINGDCGSGKTYYFITTMLSEINKPVLFVCPSKKSIKENTALVREHTDKSAYGIYSDEYVNNKTVAERIGIEFHYKNHDVVLCTIQMFEMLKPYQYSEYQVVVDDPLAMIHPYDVSDFLTNPIIGNYLKKEGNEFVKSKYFSRNKKLYNLASKVNGTSAVCEKMIELGNRLDTKKFKLMIVGERHYTPKKDNKKESQPMFKIYSTVMIPSEDYFPKDAILIGEGVEDNEWLYLHNKDNYKTITMDFTPKAKDTHIYYYLDDQDNTRTFKESNPVTYRKITDDVIHRAGNNCLLLNNTTYGQFKYPSSWKKIDSNCHSLNEYQDYEKIVCLKSANFQKVQSKYLSEIFGSDDYVYRRISVDMTYQAIMRTAIRNRNSDKGCTIYVLDRKMAEYLKEKLDDHNVTLHKIDLTENGSRVKSTRTKYKKKIWDTGEAVKATNIVKMAKDGYYDSKLNMKILFHDNNGQRERLKQLDLWNQVTTRGKYRKGENV